MKKYILSAFLLMAVSQLQAQQSTTNTQTTPAADINKVLAFKDADHDMGRIPYGKPVEYDVTITNISKDSVKLENVQAGCGCTTPKWQAGTYAPGQSFKITVGFNGFTEGHFSKSVTVYFSGGLTRIINFHGETYKETAPTSSK